MENHDFYRIAGNSRCGTLVSSLVMVVQDKQSDIAILRTLGLSPASIMQVFMIQGMVIGLLGITIGVILGVLLSLNLSHIVKFIENITGSELMPSDVYYISGVPTHVVASDIGLIAAVAFVMCLLATIYPAWSASRTDPHRHFVMSKTMPNIVIEAKGLGKTRLKGNLIDCRIR